MKKVLEWLKWRLWWLARPKYTVGVFVAAFESYKGDDFICLVRKRLGIRGVGMLTLPGGGKKYNQTIEQAAITEFSEETGFKIQSKEDLVLVNVYSSIDHRDVVMLFLYTSDRVIDTSVFSPSLEIEEIRFTNVKSMRQGMLDDHFEMAQLAYQFWKSDISRGELIPDPCSEGHCSQHDSSVSFGI